MGRSLNSRHILLCCAAQKVHLFRSIFTYYAQFLCHSLYSVLPFNTVQMQFPVYLKKERYTLIEQSIECISNKVTYCSISAHQSYFAELSLALKISNLRIMLELCPMLLCTNYAQNYSSIISGSLINYA